MLVAQAKPYSSSKGPFHLISGGRGEIRGLRHWGPGCLAVSWGEMEEGRVVQTLISGTDHWHWNSLGFLFKSKDLRLQSDRGTSR